MVDRQQQEADTILKTIIEPQIRELINKSERRPQGFSKFITELQQIDKNLLKKIEFELVENLSSLNYFIEKFVPGDCFNYLSFLKKVISLLAPFKSLHTFLYLKNATQSIFTCPDEILFNSDHENIEQWLQVYNKLLEVNELLLHQSNSERVECISEYHYFGYFIETLEHTTKVFSFKNWNFLENQVKKVYEKNIISFIEKIISTGTEPTKATLLPHFSSVALVLKNLMKNLGFKEANAETVILILRAASNLFKSCFEKNRFNNFFLNFRNRSETEKWKSNYWKLLFSYLPPFLYYFQHENDYIRQIVAEFCKFMTINCQQLPHQSLIFATIVQFAEEQNETIKEIAEEAKTNMIDAINGGPGQMETFSLNILRERLRSLSATAVQVNPVTIADAKELVTAIKYISGLFKYTKYYAREILFYKEEIKNMLRSFYRIIEFEENKQPIWLKRADMENDFSHFGPNSNRDQGLCLYFKPKFKSEEMSFIINNIVYWLTILTTTNLAHKGIINHMINKEFLEIRENFFLLIGILEILIKIKLERENSNYSWLNNQLSNPNLNNNLKQCLIKPYLNNVLKNQWLSVTHHCLDLWDSLSLDRCEPDGLILSYRIEMTCMGLRGIQLIVEIFDHNHDLESEIVESITLNVLSKCTDILQMVSLSANRCLFQIVKYWITNCRKKFREDLHSSIAEGLDEALQDFARLREGPQTPDCDGAKTCIIRRNLMFFRKFSSISYCLENELRTRLWKTAHPYILKYLKSEIQSEVRKYRTYKNSLGYILFLEVLATYGDMIEHVGINNEEIGNLVEELALCLSPDQSKTTNKVSQSLSVNKLSRLKIEDLAIKMYKDLCQVNKQLVLERLLLTSETAISDNIKTELRKIHETLNT